MMNASKRLLLSTFCIGLGLAVPALHAEPRAEAKQFVYVLRVTPPFHKPGAWTERETAIVSRHFERLAKAAAARQVILAGRTSEALEQTFGFVIFEAEDDAAARRFMADDPAVASGLMSASLHPFNVALLRASKSE